MNLAESAEEAEDINKQIQEHAAGDDSSYAEVGELQKPGDRKRLDPELKAAVIERDNYKCVSCGLLLTGSFAYASREIHHPSRLLTSWKNHVTRLVKPHTSSI